MSLITTEISQGVARGASKYDFETVYFVCNKDFLFKKLFDKMLISFSFS